MELKSRVMEILKESPGLTGKQIAKKLGDVDKSDLNRFLYNDMSGLFQQHWKWYLLEEHRKTFELNQSTWIDEQLLEDCLLKCDGVLESTTQQWTIKFPKKANLLLVAGARLLALVNQAAHDGKTIELDFTECRHVKHYLDRAGFFNHIHSTIKVIPNRSENSKADRYRGNSANLFEMDKICLEDFDYTLPEKLTKGFVYHAGAEYYHAAFTIFAELIGNVQEHSMTPIPGFVAFQVYQGNRRHIQTVISDSGLGIAGTLKSNLHKHYPQFASQLDLTACDIDAVIVEEALTTGGLSQFGSNPDGAARGLGLKKSQNYAAKYNADVVVRQPNFEIKLRYENGALVDVVRRLELKMIRGTQICFDFYLD